MSVRSRKLHNGIFLTGTSAGRANAARNKFRRAIRPAMLCVLALLAAAAGAPDLRADSLDFQARAGIAGVSKAGRWIPVRVELAGQPLPAEARLELQTRDGDGLNVHYPGVGPWLYGKYGPVREEMRVRAVAADGAELAGQTLATRVLPSTDRLHVVFGELGDLEPAALRRAGVKKDGFTLVSFQDPADFPDHWIGYDAVDTLLITTRHVEPIQQLSKQQFDALQRWVELGGRLLLSIGRSGEQLLAQDDSWWAQLVPGTFAGVAPLRSTSGLETFANAAERLDPMPAVELSEARGLARIHDGVGARRDQPLVIENAYGLGQVTFIAFDLDDPAVDRWHGRAVLLGKLLAGDSKEVEPVRDDSRGRRVTHFGYEDITGQLRAALDQFQGVRVVAFSAIAGLIAVYVLLIGPGDYFFLKRIVHRMAWSWITFPLIVIAFGVATVLLAGASRGRTARVSQVDLVDVDLERGVVRGTTWAHVYSPSSQALELHLEPNLPGTSAVDDVLLTWQGLPGRGLGGLNAVNGASLFPTANYAIDWNPAGNRVGRIHDYPLAASSTASFVGILSGETESLDAGSLQASGATNLLSGTVVNPWPETLRDAALLYGEWIYLITRDFEPGTAIDVDSQLVPKTLSWWLTRRRIVQDRDVSTPWDPTATDDIPRILEMLMFHESAGGAAYTRLSHRHQPHLDLSDQLRLGRAVLVGRVEAPAARLKLGRGAAAPELDQQYTFFRFVIPVDSASRPRDR